jgi:hypothetical protein
MLHSIRLQLALALAAGALAMPLPAAQGPDQGSPFVDAPLPFPELKAAPDSSFDILVASLGVFLLVPLTAAAFMGLARLRNLEASMGAELKQLRETVREAGGTSAAAAGDSGAVAEALQSLARATEAQAGSGPSKDTDRILAALEDLQAAQAASAKAAADRLHEALAAVVASGAGAAGREVETLGPLDAAREFLLGLGYSDVKVVTPASEVTPELLAGGAVVVEARREGATHKGKVLFEAGAPSEAQLQGGHGMFP